MGERVESIVKYHGDISDLVHSIGLAADILNEHYAIMDLSKEEQLFLSVQPQVEYIEEQKLLSFLNSPAITTPCISEVLQENAGLTGKGVLMAILDSGIDYQHKDFINEDGTTRILAIWDQNTKGTPPTGFTIGNEYSQEEINNALWATSSGNIPARDQIGHGTAAAGLAAGNGRASKSDSFGSAPEASLLIVRLAQSTDPYFTSDTNIMRGIQYAIETAASLNMPLVINLSAGTNQGSHDGSSLFEQYINDISTRWKTAIVVPTGNEGASGKHFQGRLATGGVMEAAFTIQSRLKSLSITLLKSFVDQLKLEIIDSDGNIIYTIDLTNMQVIPLAASKISVSVVWPLPFNSDQSIRLIFQDINGNTLMATNWIIRFKGISIVDGSINMWLPVTEVCGENTAFLNPEVNTTLTIPSTVPNVLSVGGCGFNNTYACFSGRGFTMSNVVKPEFCAPAVDVVSTAIGGDYDKFSGTSFAAAITAGACALMMQWGIVNGNDLTMYGQRLKAFLEYGALKQTSIIDYPDPAWGYGALCLKNTLDYAKTFTAPGSSFIHNNIDLTPLSEATTPYRITELQDFNPPNNNNLPNIITRYNMPEGENPAVSENYINLMIPYDFNTRRFLAEQPDFLISSILQDRYAVVHVPAERESEYTEAIAATFTVERSRVCGLLYNPALDAAGITAVKQYQNLNFTGRGVLVGMVDTGIDYNLNTFKYEDGRSKIVRIWDQSIQSSDINRIPASFIYGTEYTNEQINQAIASDNPYSVVPSRDEVGHGTFLASLMAGRATAENEEGAAPDAELVIVKLKQAKRITRNYTALLDYEKNAYDSTDVVNGVEYLINISRIEGKPIVILLGVGTSDSAHDGLTYMEQYLSSVASILDVIVVSAVGNEGDRRHHASGRLLDNEDMREIEFNVAEKTTGFFMNMWAFTPDRLSISLISPLGKTIERRKFINNISVSYNFILETSQIYIDYAYPNAKDGSQSILIRLVNPQIGLWKLRVYGDLIIDGRFNIWMPIYSLWNNTAYFLQPDVRVTATTPSTAPALISVGAYNSFDGSIYVSSSRGPNRLDELCPDFVAPGVNVTSVVPGGTNGAMTGTSVAAAITAGACALMLQWAVIEGHYPAINNYRMKTFLLIGLTQRPGIIYPDVLWGYGELDLINSFINI